MKVVNTQKYTLKQTEDSLHPDRFWHLATVLDADREFQIFYDLHDDKVDAAQVIGAQLLPIENDYDRASLEVLMMAHGITAKPIELPCL